MAALDRGWIPRGSLTTNSDIADACQREDSNDFICIIKKDQLESSVRSAVAFILESENASNDTSNKVMSLQGTDFHNKASALVTEYFANNYAAGATCDFGGIAMLMERNRDESGDGDDSIHYYYDKDGYFSYSGHDESSMPQWVLLSSGLALAVIGAMLGFVLAMRYSPSFNQRVRKSKSPALRRLTTSEMNLIRISLNLPKLSDYEEIQTQLKEMEHTQGDPIPF